MADLMTQDMARLIDVIHNTDDVKQLVAIVKQIDALKVALESVDAFHAQSVKYARLEADALLRVCELGGVKKLPQKHRKTAEWLMSLSDDERDKQINRCSEGLTIDAIYRKEVLPLIKLADAYESVRFEKEYGRMQLTEHGIYDAAPVYAEIDSSFPEDTAHDIKEGVRNSFLKHGAVGCGDGLFVMPDSGRQEISDALRIRARSIVADLYKMHSIADARGEKIHPHEILPHHRNSTRWIYERVASILAEMGCYDG